jgi:hypothetical protein
MTLKLEAEDGLSVRRAKQICLGIELLIGGGVAVEIAAEHDVIYAGAEGCVTDHPELVEKMEALGWHNSSEFGCWAFFT